MPFYSDYSSDEDFHDGDSDFWNPNDLIDNINTAATEDEKAKLRKELIGRFLEQQRPMLTSKMREFLADDGIPEALMSFVTRLDEVELKSDPSRKTIRPLNPSKNEEPVRKSFNVMEIFINPMNDLDVLIHEKLDVLLRELFKIFRSNSAGNFHHFNKVMEQLLVRAPVETTQTLVNEELIWTMLDFLHESAVVDCLIDIFCCGFPRQSDTIAFYKSLVDVKVFDRIGEKLYTQGQPSAPYVGDFFVKLLEKLSSFEMSGILFISLCRSSTFVEGLFRVATNPEGYPLAQRQTCANVLRELLLKSGEKMFEHADFARPIPNMLSAIHDKLHDHSKVFVAPLCEALIYIDGKKKENSIPFSAFVVKRAFGTYRFNLVEILTDLIICNPEVLNNVPQAVWRVLGAWFVEYSHNNLYHSLFYKMIQIMVRENHLESQQALLKQYKFLSRIIEHYRAPEQTDARGFILLIANTLRLGADLQNSTGWLKHYLASHDPWKSFLPILRHDTEMQLKRYNDITSDMIDEDDEEGGDEDLDIDLGSNYARSLGFEDEIPEAEVESTTPKKKKKKTKKNKKKKEPESKTPDQSANQPNHTPTKSELIEKETNDDEITDPSLSKEEWWQDLKGEFSEEEKIPVSYTHLTLPTT
eukprot:TRINITY_DN5190_c0_g1_i1.p1 TRINITY_DN5190_c0_g1~~TRINITY_DN5190_c0_g1_i1.p1  ORF type:complete len:642 (+),score=169.38 TRINITY_DN5190_c0_g1_i1:118-2043(+)